MGKYSVRGFCIVPPCGRANTVTLELNISPYCPPCHAIIYMYSVKDTWVHMQYSVKGYMGAHVKGYMGVHVLGSLSPRLSYQADESLGTRLVYSTW